MAPAHPEQPQATQRFAPRDEPVAVILGDFFRQVTLNLRHFPTSSDARRVAPRITCTGGSISGFSFRHMTSV